MSDPLSKMSFEADLAELPIAPDAPKWALTRKSDLELWATVSPSGHPGEKFIARLAWAEYPGIDPPSVKFVDPETKRIDVASAWPLARSFRPQSFDICATWTAEGFEVHPEWRQDVSCCWPTIGNVILQALRILQHELDVSFAGRFKS